MQIWFGKPKGRCSSSPYHLRWLFNVECKLDDLLLLCKQNLSHLASHFCKQYLRLSTQLKRIELVTSPLATHLATLIYILDSFSVTHPIGEWVSAIWRQPGRWYWSRLNIRYKSDWLVFVREFSGTDLMTRNDFVTFGHVL